ncbi:tetratricopeptide repeat protein [Paraliomyxa miuraensis]|uniref:tetratricopeptide repeat protein n=1 Tax=Paraliomyxa miuraensis TaxID=376150 RepID=UPI00224E7F68|nr:tetratricopeptide repeat protein [Paraliomyxa miuraensis]MCX4242891.1 tetratricopeptide repeat protein [Paraliomyxa miuraensis]
MIGELGELARLRGDLAAAGARLEQALRLREAALGPDHPLVAGTLTLLAQVHLDRGDRALALAMLERAHRIVGQQAGDPLDRVRVAESLARQTGQGRRDRSGGGAGLACRTGRRLNGPKTTSSYASALVVQIGRRP